MKTTTNTNLDHLLSEILILSQTNESLKGKVSELEAQIAWFKRQIFGKKSERIVSQVDKSQLMLPGLETVEVQEEESKQTIPAHERRKRKKKGGDKIVLSPDLPVKTTVVDLPENDKICKETGKPLKKIGEEVTHKLAYQPGSYYIKEIIRPKYAHPDVPEKGVFTAFLPDSILPKCRADNSLLAEIITKKFADHLPLYRISEGMSREGVKIHHKLLSKWVVRCGMALKPLFDVMAQSIVSSENVFMDEIPVKLLAKEKCKTSYIWAMVGGKSSDPPYKIYHFRTNRCHHHAVDLLKNYQGTLHSDKYEAYVQLASTNPSILWCPCWAHIRRKFFEAAGDPKFRAWMLRKIKYLFMFERIAWTKSPEERLQIRHEKEEPIIDEMIEKTQDLLINGQILPKSNMRKALGYFCSLKSYLKNYTKSPFARLDNNVAERAVRPLAIGRKNWLFFGSKTGGEAGGILLSFVQTCRGLGINPREYLEDIFERLMSHNAQRLHELLPDEWLKKRKAPL